jgi:hypothetical protein
VTSIPEADSITVGIKQLITERVLRQSERHGAAGAETESTAPRGRMSAREWHAEELEDAL